MLQKQHVLLLFRKWHLGSSEAECTGVEAGGSGRDQRTKELGTRRGGVYQGQLRLVQGTVFKTEQEGKTKGREARREIRTGMHERDFPVSQAIFCKRAPIWDHPPLGTQWWGEEREGASLSLWGTAWLRVVSVKKSPSRVWRENNWGMKNSEVGVETRCHRDSAPTPPPTLLRIHIHVFGLGFFAYVSLWMGISDLF